NTAAKARPPRIALKMDVDRKEGWGRVSNGLGVFGPSPASSVSVATGTIRARDRKPRKQRSCEGRESSKRRGRVSGATWLLPPLSCYDTKTSAAILVLTRAVFFREIRQKLPEIR